MKKIVTTFILLACLMATMDSLHASLYFCEDLECGPKSNFTFTSDHPTFRRTYQPSNIVHRKPVVVKAKTRGSNGPVITKADMENHLALDKMHRLTIIPVGSSVTMDVQGIDENGDQPQVWDMPNFADYAPVERDIQHITPESSGYDDEYPETTHCLFQATDGIYRLYELTDDDLFALGSINEDENGDAEVWDLYYSFTPLPLEWGLDFEGEVIIEYTEDPEVDSTITISRCEVVAYGTLNTYDEGPVQALKLHVNLSFKDYKDGLVIDEASNDHVVWYSEEGHYLVALLEQGAPMTGEVMFTNMLYYRISESVSVDPVNSGSASLSFFPNPVSAGDVLTISNKLELHVGLIQLYDMQGRLVQQIDLSGLGNVRNFQVQLPSDLVAGMYTYRASDPSGAQIGQGKLNIR
jgi:hypothetical protein